MSVKSESEPDLKPPEILKELWMLWCPNGFWVQGYDEDEPADTYIATFSEKEAKVSAEYLKYNLDLVCYPVRVL